MNAETRRLRQITTPEGIALPFEVASPVDRIAAFGVDFLLVHGGVALVTLLGFIMAGAGFGAYALSSALLTSFFLRNFYFIILEVRWGGTTIGKRRLGLRVISRDGGPLTAESVIARNLTRDIEVFLPLTALVAPQALIPGVPAWAALVGTLWLLILALLPALGRDAPRVGDLVAGTLVVKMPRKALLPDLAAASARPETVPVAAGEGSHEYVFTKEQLDLYGIRELQVLEDLLRRGRQAQRMKVLDAVARRIMRKIRWPRDRWEVDTWEFLSAFYRAQRARLEEKMLFGVRQEKKIK